MTAITDSEGNYVFNSLGAGIYVIIPDEYYVDPESIEVTKSRVFESIAGINFVAQGAGPFSRFDLRDVDGVTPVKDQRGGT